MHTASVLTRGFESKQLRTITPASKPASRPCATRFPVKTLKKRIFKQKHTNLRLALGGGNTRSSNLTGDSRSAFEEETVLRWRSAPPAPPAPPASCSAFSEKTSTGTGTTDNELWTRTNLRLQTGIWQLWDFGALGNSGTSNIQEEMVSWQG
ncbi:unnamed protein product [Pleuronectes platessa]|uniref:Uncharacterized protein n=1 Tax=Pleuronectes platessa TaxID=8262 RepID=A0A9N7UAP1_PLEPL|nr:unnamed protein product [Pleuronectes platessa]